MEPKSAFGSFVLFMTLVVGAQASLVCGSSAGKVRSAAAIYLDAAIWEESSIAFVWLLPEMSGDDVATFRINVFFKDEDGVEREYAITPAVKCDPGCAAYHSFEFGTHRPTVTYHARIYANENGCGLVYLLEGEIAGDQ